MRPLTPLALLGALSLGSPDLASAASTDPCAGGLRFVGVTRDAARSVWLSGTNAGRFSLEAQNKLVDTWTRTDSGLHLSLSDVVSKGNGGTHRLRETQVNCLIDTQNQVGGIRPPEIAPMPPIIGWPENPIERPVAPMPPIEGGPSLPIERPVAPMPPIEGGPSLPIERPVAPMPPIEGIPTQPIEPPGRPTPPIEGIPTQPIEPPGRPTPPIEGIPTQPIEPPGGRPTPPIEGIPTQPIEPPGGRPTPPIEGLPEHPIEKPGSPDDGRATLDARQPEASPTRPACPDDSRGRDARRDDPRYAHCFGAADLVPITPGREYDVDSRWNVWADLRTSRVDDDRFGRDGETDTGTLAVGADRRLRADLVLGLMATFEDSDSDLFGRAMEFDTDGMSVGPYVGYRLAEAWALDVSLTVGRYDNDTRILVLEGDHDTDRYSLMANLNGQFVAGDDVRIRPRVSLSYVESRHEAHTMRLGNTGRSVRFGTETTSLGTLTATTEITRTFVRDSGLVTEPSLELGISYEFDRTNDGDVLSRRLVFEEVSPWSGSVRAGVQAQLSESAFVRVDLGYLSLGQNNYDTWELGAFLSYLF